jgi:hypothetical protein
MLLPGITPTNMLPKLVSSIVKYTLPVIMEDKLRTLFIFNKVPPFTLTEILAIVFLAVIAFIMIGILYRKSKRKEI